MATKPVVTKTVSEVAPVAKAAVVIPEWKKQGELSIQLLSKCGMPVLPNGSTHDNWKADFITIDTVMASADGFEGTAPVVTIHGKQGVTKIPSIQRTAMLWISGVMFASPRSGTGAAYALWVAKNKDNLIKALGKYTLRIHNLKSQLPVLQARVVDLIKIAELQAVVIQTGMAIEKPVQRTVHRNEQAEDDYETVL
jgi:hypothetical protein